MVALFAALIAPFFIDWTAYRTAFEREAARILGQPVHVAGTAKVRILPLPSVTFTDLTVGENPDGTPMMTVDSFAMHAELMPFLSGELKIVDMVLVRPDVSVTVGEGGTVAWTARREAPVDPGKVQIENLRIEDGSLRIEGLAGGRVILGEGFSADVSAQSLVGPWHIDAQGKIDGVPVALAMSTGRMQEEGSIRLKAVARRFGQPYRLTLDGPLALKEGVLSWDGAFEVQPAREPAVAGEGILPDALPVRVAGRYAATPQAVELPDYRMEVGPRDDPYTITGTASANIREEIAFRATADGRQINLDRIGPQATQPQAGTDDDTGAETGTDAGTDIDTGSDGDGEAASVSLDRRIAVLRDLVDRIPVPPVEGEIDILLPAVVAGDTVIREVTATVEPDRDGWRVRAFKATLPGNTTVEARGRVGTGGDFGFSGHMLLASRQPTGFAAWLAGKSNAALRQLDRAGFSADVTFSGSQSTFDNLELVLNEATLRGKLQRLGPVDGEGRPAIIAELSGRTLDTDDLIAIYSLTETRGGAALTDHDLDITIRADLLEGRQLHANGVNARVRVGAGSVAFDYLEVGDFYGAQLSGSGSLNDLLDQPGGRIELNVAAPDGSRLAELALNRLGDDPFLAALAGDPALSSDFSAKLEIEARPKDKASKGTATLSGFLGGTAFALRDRFEGRPAAWREAAHDLFARFEQADPQVLARQFALPVAPFGADGPMVVTAEMSGKPSGTMTVNLAANAPDTDFSASGEAAFGRLIGGEDEPRFDLAVTLGTQDIDPWLLMAGYPLPGTGEGHPASIAFTATGEEGVYRLTSLSGTHGENSFSGEIKLDTVRAARPKATGRLVFDTVSAPFVGELLLGAGTIAGDGISAGLTDSEFGVPLIRQLDAEIKLSADQLDLGGGPLAGALSADAVLIEGALSLPQFSANWSAGTMTGNLALRNSAGNAILNTQMTLAGVDLASLSSLAGFPDIVGGEADIGMTLDASGRSFKGLISALSGSGVFRLNDVMLDGISTGGLGDILETADAEGFEITAQNVEPLVRRAILHGGLENASVSGAFSIGRSQVQVRNVELRDEDGMLDASGSYNPVSGETEITATLKLDPGEHALSGADPSADLAWRGTPEALTLELDTKAMEGYLSLRAFEREQRKVEILQETVLEKQRLRREVILTRMRMARREAARDEELQRLKALQDGLDPDAAPDESAPAPGGADAPGDTNGSAAPASEGREATDTEGQGAVAPEAPVQQSNVQDGAVDEASPTAQESGAAQDTLPGVEVPALPDEGPVPEPSPARQARNAPAPRERAPVVETRPLQPAAPNTSNRRATDLFEDIRRKLFGEEPAQ